MHKHTVGNNLRRTRIASDMTQEELAGRVGISLPGYRNFESGRTVPKVDVLMRLAKELGVDLQELVTDIHPLEAVRFRAARKLKTREQILVHLAKKLQDYNELEQLLASNRIVKRKKWKSFNVPPSPKEAALSVRKRFHIDPLDPIMDICGLLEGKRIKIIPLNVKSEGFFGLSVAVESGGPAIAVNVWDRVPVERWIFTAAHELGHLLLHRNSYDRSQAEELEAEESQANEFASYFIMPEDSFRNQWEKCCGLPFVDRVFKVKRIFHVSYKTVLYRLAKDRGLPNVWAQFQRHYRNRFGRTLFSTEEPASSRIEPKSLEAVDFLEERLSCYVQRALCAGLISRSKGAEILHLSLKELQQRIEEWDAEKDNHQKTRSHP